MFTGVSLHMCSLNWLQWMLFAFVWHFSLGWCETAQYFNRPKFPDKECRSDIEDMFKLINLASEPLSDFLSLGGVWFPIEGRTEWFSTTEWLGEWWHASGWEQFFFTILQFSRPPPIKETLNLNRLFRLWLKELDHPFNPQFLSLLDLSVPSIALCSRLKTMIEPCFFSGLVVICHDFYVLSHSENHLMFMCHMTCDSIFLEECWKRVLY